MTIKITDEMAEAAADLYWEEFDQGEQPAAHVASRDAMRKVLAAFAVELGAKYESGLEQVRALWQARVDEIEQQKRDVIEGRLNEILANQKLLYDAQTEMHIRLFGKT